MADRDNDLDRDTHNRIGGGLVLPVFIILVVLAIFLVVAKLAG